MGRELIVFVGGDRRTIHAASWLQDRGHEVTLFGFSPAETPRELRVASTLGEVTAQTRAFVLPVRGPDAEGRVALPAGGAVRTDRSFLETLLPGTVLVTGWAGDFLTAEARATRTRLIEIMPRDDFSYYNSLPTSEGAICEAMQRSEVTLAGSRCHVVGYGRCGKILARQLHGLGASVTVVSRSTGSRAEATSMGYSECDLGRWRETAGEADFIFNTAPGRVVTRAIVEKTRPTVIILDIAAVPGVLDMEAVEELDRMATVLPGLPGKCAPKTAGVALARTLLAVLSDSP